MIMHATERVIQQCGLKTIDKLAPANALLAKSILVRDMGSGLHEWGVNCFDYLGKCCLVLANFASGFALFIYDARSDQLCNLGNFIARSLLDSYIGDADMTRALQNMFKNDSHLVSVPLRNRTMSVFLNHMIVDYARRGELFRSYIDYNHVLHLKQLNYDVNFIHAVKKRIDGKEVYIKAGPYFRDLVIARYGTDPNL